MATYLAGVLNSSVPRQLLLAEMSWHSKTLAEDEMSVEHKSNIVRVVNLDSELLSKRKSFYAKCHAIFLQVQEMRSKHFGKFHANYGATVSSISSSSSLLRELKQACQGYRRELWARFNELAMSINQQQQQQSSQSVEDEMFSMWRMYTALHLAEIVLLADTPAALVIEQLLDWVNTKQSDELLHLKVGVRDILSHVVPLQHPQLWSTVTELVVRARFEDLLSFLNRLLQNNDGSDGAQEISYLQKVITKYPSLRILRTSETDFNGRWRLWQSEVSAARDRTDHQSLKEVLSILSGNVDVLLTKYCKTWREQFVFTLFHKAPSVQVNQLQLHLESLSNVDELMRSILQLDISKFALEASLIDPWFAGVSIDMIDTVGKVEPEVVRVSEKDSPVSLRDYLLIAYGSVMVDDTKYWDIGLDVFNSCGKNGKDIMKEYVVRIPLIDAETKDKLIAYCVKRNMQEEKHQLCTIYARQALDNEDFGTAIASFIESQDSSYLSDILERILSKYVASKGTVEFDDILNSVRVHISVHAELLFLDDFSQACELLRDNDEKGAATCFAQLLSVDHTPMKFVPIILLECLKLMQKTSGLFSSSDLFEILRHIEDVMLSYRRDEYLDFARPKTSTVAPNKPSVEKELKNLRLLSIQNLGNSFLANRGGDLN